VVVSVLFFSSRGYRAARVPLEPIAFVAESFLALISDLPEDSPEFSRVRWCWLADRAIRVE
jgi:hypothetical protein